MDFILPIFPEGSLVSSIITTTWVGVWVVALLNLRLGWVLSGLVVPGYLVPLLILRPWGAAIVIIESVLTYLIVWFFSEIAPRFGQWSRLFGRDRFFALVLVSVVVRIAFDGWLLPSLGAYLNHRYGWFIPFAGEFHSFGLIIISLTANQFWKTGLLRGLLVLAVTLGMTHLIVRYGLMEFTNFRISNLNYLYEDVATSILASPKAYIILLTTAFLASRMNLKYGLEYSGILIPALVALQWYQPTKIITTVAEAVIIYGIGMLVLRLPVFARTTIEGARKLLLFFNISFAYKLALGFLLLWLAPSQKVTDYFGFGYLLATLLAMKMHEKNILPRMTRVTLQTSITGAALASIIGFAIMVSAESVRILGGAPPAAAMPAAMPAARLLRDVFQHDRIELYRARLTESRPTQPVAQVVAFAEALQLLRRFAGDRSPSLLQAARNALHSVDYDVELMEARYLYLHDIGTGAPRGLYVIDLQASGTLSVEVPLPVESKGLAAAGFRVFESLGARYFAVAGAEWTAAGGVAAGVLQNSDTFFQAFHRAMAQGNVLQLRRMQFPETGQPGAAPAAPLNRLWVFDQIPNDLNLVSLRSLIGDFDTPFGSTRQANLQRDTAAGSFAELHMAESSIRRVTAGVSGDPPGPAAVTAPIDGVSIRRSVVSAVSRNAARGSESYLPATLPELLYLDTEVLSEILVAIQTDLRDGVWSEAGLARLAGAANAAAAMGFLLERHRDAGDGSEYLLLRENEFSLARGYRGTYLFRVGPASEYVIEAPRPGREPGTLQFALSLFVKLQARALLIGGSHPEANADGVADIVAPRNSRNLFNVVQQVLLRDMAAPEMTVVQCRSMRRPGADNAGFDVILSSDTGARAAAGLTMLGRRLSDQLGADGLTVRYADGSAEVAGHDIGAISQMEYLQQTRGRDFLVLWLGRAARAMDRQPSPLTDEDRQYAALRIATLDIAVAEYAAVYGTEGGFQPDAALRAMMARYGNSRSILALQEIAAHTAPARLVRILDPVSGTSYLLLTNPEDNRLRAVASLSPADSPSLSISAVAGPAALQQALAASPPWLTFGP
ncbi:MAG: poly-gamma-glutamate biosynthesis protein PgsC/CapC [Dongiaceae bacterium]